LGGGAGVGVGGFGATCVTGLLAAGLSGTAGGTSFVSGSGTGGATVGGVTRTGSSTLSGTLDCELGCKLEGIAGATAGFAGGGVEAGAGDGGGGPAATLVGCWHAVNDSASATAPSNVPVFFNLHPIPNLRYTLDDASGKRI
jgi:hypothetical protein